MHVDKTTPKFSIITVNLNNEEGLQKTIDSVACQSFRNYEHIIIDGGSIDSSVNLIKSYNSNYNGIRAGLYWVSESDEGIYNAMNKGIKVATGNYCLFLNSGDWLICPTILEQVEKTKRKEDILYGNIINHNGIERLNEVFYPSKIDLATLAKGSLGHPAMFIKLSLFENLGNYSEKYSIVSDWLWYTKAILIHNISYFYLEFPTTYFSNNGISSTPNTNQEIRNAKSDLFPECVWNLAEQYNELHNSYNGLLNSGTMKLAKKVGQLKELFK